MYAGRAPDPGRSFSRVLVLGSAGAGKTTLALELGELTGIPVIHLDRHFWKPGWVSTPETEWAELVSELAGGDRWIIDGNYAGTLRERMQRADAAVFMDFSRLLCLFRVMRRVSRYHGRTRPDMTDGCPDRVDPEFIRWIMGYPRKVRPLMLEILDRHSGSTDIYVLRRPSEVREFLAGIAERGGKCRSG